MVIPGHVSLDEDVKLLHMVNGLEFITGIFNFSLDFGI